MGSVSVKEGIPVGIRPPSLTHRSHLGWLGHIGHGVVSLSQLVLNTLKGAEGIVWRRTAVHCVAVSLSPSLEEDRQCAGIGLPHCLHKSHDVRDDVVVHILGTKAWPLTLIRWVLFCLPSHSSGKAGSWRETYKQAHYQDIYQSDSRSVDTGQAPVALESMSAGQFESQLPGADEP